MAGPTDDPVLARFRAVLDQAYGPRLARVVLYGSRARGEARPDSDYDIGVFLHDWTGFDREARTIAEIETDLLTSDRRRRERPAAAGGGLRRPDGLDGQAAARRSRPVTSEVAATLDKAKIERLEQAVEAAGRHLVLAAD